MNNDIWNIKTERLYAAMDAGGYQVALMNNSDNITWLTSGKDVRVSTDSNAAQVWVVLSRQGCTIFAYSMDGRRVVEEVFTPLPVELVELAWFDGSLEESIKKYIGNQCAVSDSPLPFATCDPFLFQDAHYPLLDFEIDRYRALGRIAEQILAEAATAAHPGMTELEMKRFLLHRYAEEGLDAPVVIIGSDQRIFNYRHCLPTEQPMEHAMLLAPAPRKWGLCCPISRMVTFDDQGWSMIYRQFEALKLIEAASMAMTTSGTRFNAILETQKDLYVSLGYPQEWKKHFQGGLTGYIINNPTYCTSADKQIIAGQVFNWYVTISGAKIEETVIATSTGHEVASLQGAWPTQKQGWEGREFDMPQIWRKQ